MEVPNLEVIDDLKGDELVDEDCQSQFRSLIGKLGWLAKNARPDLGFDSLVMSTKVGKANVNDLKQVVKMIKKLKAEPSEMKVIDIGPVEDWKIVGHGDAGYRSLPDKVSSCGGQESLKLGELQKIGQWTTDFSGLLDQERSFFRIVEENP